MEDYKLFINEPYAIYPASSRVSMSNVVTSHMVELFSLQIET